MSKNTYFMVYDILWDTNGEDVSLPVNEVIDDENIEKDEIADYLSDKYGFLVISYLAIEKTFDERLNYPEDDDNDEIDYSNYPDYDDYYSEVGFDPYMGGYSYDC